MEKVIEDYKKFPFDYVRNMKVAKSGRGHPKSKTIIHNGEKEKVTIDRVNAIAAFDIETTKIPGQEHSVMFVWQFCFMSLDDDMTVVVLGRTWDEFKDFMYKLECALNGKTLLVFDHNFNYEFSYLKSI